MTTTTSDAVSLLSTWLAENCPPKQQVNWDKVQLQLEEQPNGDRVLVTNSLLKKGTKLPVPPACVLTETKVRESVVGHMFAGLDVYTLFALFLMVEKLKVDAKQDSFWQAYLGVLPTDIRFHPITYVNRGNSELTASIEKYPQLYRALKAQDEKLSQEWNRALQVLLVHKMKQEKQPEAQEETVSQVLGLLTEGNHHDLFIWASCMVISRAFRMVEPNEMCMIPLADSMNHKPEDSNVQWRPKLPKGFFIISIKEDLSPSQELTSCYHSAAPEVTNKPDVENLSTLRQFLMYGFTDSGMYDDVLNIALQ